MEVFNNCSYSCNNCPYNCSYTVVRAQNDTTKQQISLIQFSIEHWYSPYKRQRFEIRSDQTFCILLVKYALSVNLHSVTRPIAYYYYYYNFHQ